MVQANSALASERGPIGLLYPGEMGTALASLLCRDGRRVVTTLQGRGPTTRRNCRTANLEELDSLEAVIRNAAVVLAVVPPGAAVQVAAQVRELLPVRHGERLVYVDANSIAPETARALAAGFAGTAVDFVDAAISGPAARLADRCVLYLSGDRAPEVAALFAGKMQVQVLGDAPGQASAMRMLLSGLTKGVIALFVEMALGACQAGVLERLLAAYRASYPGIMELVDRNLPTYPLHAARRGQEMAEVESTLSHLGLTPTVAPGIRELTVAISKCGLSGGPERKWSAEEVVSELHAWGLLRRKPDADSP